MPLSFRSFALSVLVLLPGCLGEDAPTAAKTPPEEMADVAEAPSPPLPTLVEAPEWEVGKWWRWRLTGSDGGSQEWTSVATQSRGNTWILAPDDRDIAALEAMFDWYVTGTFAKATLSDDTARGLQFYRFPLEDGARWTSQFGTDDILTLNHEATFDPVIPTPRGDLPGFRIRAETGGALFFDYDYVPAIGWFSSLRRHDFAGADPEGTILWRYDVVEWGEAFDGEYRVAEARALAEATHEAGVGAAGAAASPGVPSSFTVGQAATRIFVYGRAAASGGTAQVVLVDPAGESHRVEAVDTSAEGTVVEQDAFLASVPGEWRVEVGGAGAYTEGAFEAWELVEEARSL